MLKVEFGAMSQPLKKQVKGLRFPSMFQANADAITRLNVYGLLTESEAHRARLRLLKSIEKEMAK